MFAEAALPATETLEGNRSSIASDSDRDTRDKVSGAFTDHGFSGGTH